MTAPVTLSDPPIPSRADMRAAGKARRKGTARSVLSTLTLDGHDPIGILRAQNADRVPELVPLRMQRMLADPFSFFRGTAAIMAADLATGPHSGLLVAACGDAHVSNFGFYASPERTLVFDLNDFDEAAWAPWEWDVKRLLTSAVVGGRAAGYAEDVIEAACLRAFDAYAQTMRGLARRTAVQRYFLHLSIRDSEAHLSKNGRRALRAAAKAASKRTGERAVRRTTERAEDGRLRFVEAPPTMVRMTEQALADASGATAEEIAAAMPDGVTVADLFAAYRRTVGLDIDAVLHQYAPGDLARRVVGVGSVGTRCYLQLLVGSDGDALVLQVKEAGRSVLVEYGGIAQPAASVAEVEARGRGARVVGLQRILQAVSDPFLGYLRGVHRDYYVRQFHDMKGSIELEGLDAEAFRDYLVACSATLARAHAQSGTAAEIGGYIGRSDRVGRAVLTWSLAYADVALADFHAAAEAFGEV